VQNLSYENEFDLHVNEPVGENISFEWFRTKTRFETEAKGNSKMAYYINPGTLLFLMRDVSG